MKTKLACFCLLLVVSAPGATPPPQIELISVADPGLVPKGGNGNSGAPQLSADGDLLLFLSQANNLTTNDLAKAPAGSFTDVYLKNLRTGRLTLISAVPGESTGGNNSSGPALLSDDARYVVFQSDASDLVTNDLNGLTDVFVRDVTNSQTTLVSITPEGQSARGISTLLTATPDGRFILFESTATNLVSTPAAETYRFYLRDTLAATTRAIPVPLGAATAERAAEGAITPDGRFVAVTALRAIVQQDNRNFTQEIYLADMSSNSVAWASSNAPAFTGFPATNEIFLPFKVGPESYSPVVSADGRFVAFKTVLSSNTFLFRYDSQIGQLFLVTSNIVDRLGGGLDNSLDLQMTSDGRYILYTSLTNEGTRAQIYLWDAVSGSTRLVSVSADGTNAATGISDNAQMTPDARYVVFSSDAPDLIGGVLPGVSDALPRRVYWRDVTVGNTRLVSFDSTVAVEERADAVNPDVSNNGQIVAFEAWDPDFVLTDNNLAQDVFLRNMPAETTLLISQRDPSFSATTPNGFSSLESGSVSSNGQFVVFTSIGSNLTANDNNNALDVFVRDLAWKTNILISAISGAAVRAANSNSFEPVISADGRFVAFGSFSSDLVTNDFNGTEDIFLRDLTTGELRLVTTDATGSRSATGRSIGPQISADGRFIVFESLATNLVSGPPDLNGRPDAFVYDAVLRTNILVSVSINGEPASGKAPIISPDGRFVVFEGSSQVTTGLPFSPLPIFIRDLVAGETKQVLRLSIGGAISTAYSFSRDGRWVLLEATGVFNPVTNIVRTTEVYLYHIDAGSYSRICVGCQQASVSDDGSYVVYLSPPPNSTVQRGVWVYDRKRNVHFPASVDFAGTGWANGESDAPAISGDGRFVVFQSKANNLVPDDTNTFGDIYIRDLFAGVTLLASRSMHSTSPGSVSSRPVLGPDGRSVFFQSGSDDLAPGDQNQLRDIFVYRWSLEDSDADGLPDFWELAYFGDLSYDGRADSDQDGQSDAAELLAGTQPLEASSAFHWLPVRLNGLDVTLSWTAVPGRTYQLQYKNDLNDPGWRNLGAVTAEGFVASRTEGSEQASRRFYRLVLQP